MKRPPLHEIPLDEIMDSLLKAQPSVNVTMNIGQWDGFLQSAYDNGFNLIEVDDYELPVRAFRKIE